ncbi:MAG: serine/threonine phosphatase [Cyanothece sp. SIO1E1]|nr:serine/threonine phosphatase [Cyanothece sp. SIO1E1]
MLVCPQCQFENPSGHRFCQKCGVSLTHISCPKCDTQVEISTEHCPNCGTLTGKFWCALISIDTVFAAGGTAQAPSPLQPLENTPSTASSSITESATNQHLDSQKRYRLGYPLSLDDAATAEIEVTVLDCQPLQASPLAALYRQQAANANPNDLQAQLSFAVPTIAHPYIALQTQLYPAFPVIHDAWKQDHRTVLLLEDRSKFLQLLDLWSADQTPIPQIMHGLYRMTELWIALEPWSCQQSLLELENLRVDEDQIICLRRLYVNNAKHPPTLSDLGWLWQKLCPQIQLPQLVCLKTLCRNLETGEITSAGELRSHLDKIANELQPDCTITPMTSESFSPENLPMIDPNSADQVDQVDQMLEATAADMPSPGLPPEQSIDSDMNLPDPTEVKSASFAVDPTGDSTTDGDDAPTVALPMRLLSLEDGGRTDVGQQRDHNEDSFSIQTHVKKHESPQGHTVQARGLYILCDGMGGHAGGEIASNLAVETIQKYFETHWQDHLPSEAEVREAVMQANQAIYDLNQHEDRSGSGRMGTTLVVVLIQGNQVIVAHVGDSRLYSFTRRGGLKQMTVDHEVGQREIQRGVEAAIAYARPDAYQLTQALGPRSENFVDPDMKFLELNEGALFLLCSDGLSDNDLIETHCETHIEPLLSSKANIEEGIERLIDLANEYNGHDNITAVVIRVKVQPDFTNIRQSTEPI